MEEEVGPHEHLAARDDDAVYGHVVGVGQVGDAARRLLQRQPRSAGCRVVVAMWAPLVAVAGDYPIDRVHGGLPRTRGSRSRRLASSRRRRAYPMPICGQDLGCARIHPLMSRLVTLAFRDV